LTFRKQCVIIGYMTRKRKPREHYTEHQKLEAATVFLALGSNVQTAGVLKIPLDTFNKWRYADWFKKLIEELKAEDNLKLSARLSKLVSKALDVTEDRLTNGNYQYDPKTSQLVRVPVSLKDATKVATDLMERKDIVEDKPLQEQIEKTVDDRLKKLAEEFANFGRPKKALPDPMVIDHAP